MPLREEVIAFWNRLRALPHRERIAAELEEEMRFHRELLERDQRAGGANARDQDIALAARRQFGNPTYLAEESRDMWRFTPLETLRQDVRYAWRFLRRSPAFTLVAVLSLALGIGANTAVFTLLDLILVKSLPVRDPQALVLIEPSRNGIDTARVFAYPYFETLREQNSVLTGMFATTRVPSVFMERGRGAEVLPRGAALVSGGYFATLGVQAALGRVLGPEDDRVPGGHPVVVLSDGLWHRSFGADVGVIGTTLNINGRPLTVIGVTPPGFFGTQVGENPDVYLPMMMDEVATRAHTERLERGDWWVYVMGRLRPGVSREQAAAQLSTIFRREMLREPPFEGADAEARARWARSHVVLSDASHGLAALRRRFSRPLLVLSAMSALVLLIACTNIASLLVARGAARQREIAVRLSLGAGRRRLMRQLMTESVLLSGIGATVGIGVAFLANQALLAILQTGRAPLEVSLAPDLRVLVFTAIVAVSTGLLFGVAPAASATRLELTPALKDVARSGTGRGALRLGKALIVTQVALSVLLLFGAALFVRSLQRLYAVDVGFRADDVLLVRVDPHRNGYTGARLAAVYEQLLTRLRATPGVRAATLASHTPFNGAQSSFDAKVEGFTAPDNGGVDITRVIVDPGFFDVMGIPLRAGRALTPADVGGGGGARTAVVNETFARMFGKGAMPVGRRIYTGPKDQVGIEIVGVVRDGAFNSFRESTPPIAYWPFTADTTRIFPGTFVLRLDPTATRAPADIRSAIASVDRRIEVLTTRYLEEQIRATIANERVVAALSGFFGVLALLLAMIGLYGVMTYAVMRRTREIGVRIALGAEARGVIALILKETLTLVALGAAIGAPVALAAGRLGEALLYGLRPTDPATMALAAAILFCVAVVAGLLPARRATRVDPLTALRAE